MTDEQPIEPRDEDWSSADHLGAASQTEAALPHEPPPNGTTPTGVSAPDTSQAADRSQIDTLNADQGSLAQFSEGDAGDDASRVNVLDAENEPSLDAEQDEGIYDDEGSDGYVHVRTPLFVVLATIASVALLALLAANVYQFIQHQNDSKSQVVATVNGAPIMQRDFNRSDSTASQTLDQLIDDKLIQQEAQRLKVAIPESVVTDQINTIKRQAGSEAAYQTALKNNNLTESQLRDEIRTELLAEKIAGPNVTVTDAEAQAYYNQNKAQFGQETLAQAMPDIKSTLLQQKKSAAVQTWLSGLRQKAKIVKQLPT